ncbi:hypothetical protein IWQ47_004751 [Aquimarina sp. EL_43]|uniref:Uncharacterized protein n=1 Tax=Aquimarina atlantica TaxID=1317122 RepID=A0A023BNF1_9FLAO|nr:MULTISPECIES: hypothetical protein [Aquimarina]EZH71557.1 hypothetical protein ATO12_07040 [Aquimarina atlantica]MBG6133322.1 hypothetical protein [Aquimarina sp. EL_35]MBG6153499.1 hypothetical protein [Aquimarina sp. EL_32]MBG6171655.1 hypothetical protein [Aquimarina sp. EL_43]
MKSILNLAGVTKLSKEQQQTITGSSMRWARCCPTGRGCRVGPPGGGFCEPGYCRPNGYCIFA